MSEPGRVDSHHHVWDPSVRPMPWLAADGLEPLRRSFGVQELAAQAAAAGVTATVVVQTVSDLEETREMLALAAGSGLVAGVVGWVDLTSPQVADTLGALRAGPGGEHLVGIRHQVHDEPDPDWLRRPDVRRGLSAVAEAGLVYDLLTFPIHLSAAIDTVAELPSDARFVLDHFSKPPIAAGELEPWASDLRDLAAHPNVSCKLSGMVTEADWGSWSVDDLSPYATRVLELFGPERVMFGSDWPVCLLAARYARVVDAAEQLTAHLDAGARAAVFGGTARGVYGIG